MLEELRGRSRPQRSKAKRVLQWLLIGAFLVAIAYFVHRYSADFSSIRELAALDILLIGAWSFLSYTTYALAVYVILLHLKLEGLRPLAWIRIYYVSRLVNFVVMQGGNLYRLLILKKNYGFSYTNTIGVTGFLIVLNALVALIVSVVALTIMGAEIEFQGVDLVTWFLTITLTGVIAFIALTGLAERAKSTTFAQTRFSRPFFEIAEFFRSVVTEPSLLATVSLLSIIHFVFFVGVNYATFAAIGSPLDLGIVCVFTTIFVFTRYINVVPGNLGVSELAGGLVSEQLGIGFGNGLLVTGIVRVVELLLILVLGLIYGKFVAYSLFRRT